MDRSATFIRLSIAYLALGVTFGIGMGIAENFQYTHLHAHIGVIGFAAHGVMGLALAQWPQLSASRLAPAQFWLMVVGTPIFLIGIPFAQYHAQPVGAIVGSMAVLAAVVLFLVMLLTTRLARA